MSDASPDESGSVPNPPTAVEAATDQRVDQPTAQDILCGRGAPVSEHVGNTALRDIVLKRQDEYIKATSRARKHVIATEICQEVSTLGGRFLRKSEYDGDGWIVVTDQKQIVNKVKQLLRDMAPQARERRAARKRTRGKIAADRSTEQAANETQDSQNMPNLQQSTAPSQPMIPRTGMFFPQLSQFPLSQQLFQQPNAIHPLQFQQQQQLLQLQQQQRLLSMLLAQQGGGMPGMGMAGNFGMMNAGTVTLGNDFSGIGGGTTHSLGASNPLPTESLVLPNMNIGNASTAAVEQKTAPGNNNLSNAPTEEIDEQDDPFSSDEEEQEEAGTNAVMSNMAAPPQHTTGLSAQQLLSDLQRGLTSSSLPLQPPMGILGLEPTPLPETLEHGNGGQNAAHGDMSTNEGNQSGSNAMTQLQQQLMEAYGMTPLQGHFFKSVDTQGYKNGGGLDPSTAINKGGINPPAAFQQQASASSAPGREVGVVAPSLPPALLLGQLQMQNSPDNSVVAPQANRAALGNVNDLQQSILNMPIASNLDPSLYGLANDASMLTRFQPLGQNGIPSLGLGSDTNNTAESAQAPQVSTTAPKASLLSSLPEGGAQLNPISQMMLLQNLGVDPTPRREPQISGVHGAGTTSTRALPKQEVPSAPNMTQLLSPRLPGISVAFRQNSDPRSDLLRRVRDFLPRIHEANATVTLADGKLDASLVETKDGEDHDTQNDNESASRDSASDGSTGKKPCVNDQPGTDDSTAAPTIQFDLTLGVDASHPAMALLSGNGQTNVSDNHADDPNNEATSEKEAKEALLKRLLTSRNRGKKGKTPLITEVTQGEGKDS